MRKRTFCCLNLPPPSTPAMSPMNARFLIFPAFNHVVLVTARRQAEVSQIYPTRTAFFSIGLAFLGFSWKVANTKTSPAIPRWLRDKALVERLDAAVKVEGYSLQPPKNYPMQKGNAPAGMKGFAWVGAA